MFFDEFYSNSVWFVCVPSGSGKVGIPTGLEFVAARKIHASVKRASPFWPQEFLMSECEWWGELFHLSHEVFRKDAEKRGRRERFRAWVEERRNAAPWSMWPGLSRLNKEKVSILKCDFCASTFCWWAPQSISTQQRHLMPARRCLKKSTSDSLSTKRKRRTVIGQFACYLEQMSAERDWEFLSFVSTLEFTPPNFWKADLHMI